MFGGPKPMRLYVRDEVPELVDEEAGHSYKAGDADGEEAEAYFADVETVDGWVDERKYLKEGIIDSVREGSL